MRGVVNRMLAVVAVLALPAWRAGTMDEGIAATLFACAVGAIVPLTLPWAHVWRRYVTDRAEPWRRAKAPASGAHAVQ